MPRPQRFLESSASPRTTDLARTFYADSQLDERMSRVRQTIVEVRQRWEADRRWMAEQLLRWLEKQAEAAAASATAAVESTDQQQQLDGIAKDWSQVLTRWRVILAADRNWADLRPELARTGSAEEDFLVLREFTNEQSYSLVFSQVLQALRASDDSHVLLTVYLIELINIDLFNYSRVAPPRESRVYRGLSLSESDWLSYQRLLRRPVASRFVAVPLALTSSSKRWEVALQFALRSGSEKQQNQAATGDCGSAGGSVPCLQVIHVIDVPDTLMELYRQRFPQSVVSTICAVDIASISMHADEHEVLLRGAFFQVLGINEKPDEFKIHNLQQQGSVCSIAQQAATVTVTAHVMEFLVISANRDHLSNGRLGDQDAPARALFAAIVRVTRYGYCLELCRERGLSADEVEYAAALREAEQELHRLLQ